uniref:Uncharacterized protein n=1 Tax=Rhizophora mucronata TaxID=61149 RepID=A0A2P2R1Z3_RHIMU
MPASHSSTNITTLQENAIYAQSKPNPFWLKFTENQFPCQKTVQKDPASKKITREQTFHPKK